ncbi:MAG: DUF4159 domain-containing protein [Nitrospirae bacterium]|nr:DUF4159 domain-containing protein [Nitrospirota bacterium]
MRVLPFGLALCAVAVLGPAFVRPDALAVGPRSRFAVAQLKYEGGRWDPYPSALPSLVAALMGRTSVDANPDRVVVVPTNPNLSEYPLLYMAGDQAFLPFSDDAVRRLRLHFDGGGLLLMDDALGVENQGFHASAVSLVRRLYPDRSLQPITEDHAVYVTFHLLRRLDGGRRLVKPALYSVQEGNRAVILYSFNDLGGAWARDELGNFIYPCFPGGDYQREMAFRMGINILMYGLTLDYKKDLIHQPYILRRKT